MKSEIHGTTLQTLQLSLDSGETVFSETGALLHMSPNIELQTNFKGGLGGMFKRALTGNSLALNYFTAMGGPGEVSFTTRMPGHIVALDLNGGSDIFVQRHSFLCAPEGINLSVATSFNLYGAFGGNGLVYNRMSGNGTAFMSIDGEVIRKDLGRGESMLVHPAHLAAHEEKVNVEVRRMKGFKNLLFSGDGYSLIHVTGPGTIWLHSLSIHNLAELLTEYMPNRNK